LDLFFQTLASGLSVGAIYALVAIGYNVVFASTGVFNLAQGQIVMLGVMFVYQFRVVWGVPTAAAFVLAAVAAGVVNLLVERLSVAPLARQRGGALAHVALPAFVTTLGASLVIQNLVLLHYGSVALTFNQYFSARGIDLAGVTVTWQQIFMVVMALGIVGAYHAFTTRTRWGVGLTAMAQDPEAAALRGVPIVRGRMIAFLLAGIISGLAGATLAPVTLADPLIGFNLALKGFVAMAIGGFGSSTGALVGGGVLGLTEAFMVSYGDDQYRIFASLLLLLVIFLIRPRGLFGRLQVREV
jgi:branched-chain amino acid transport system permease protein